MNQISKPLVLDEELFHAMLHGGTALQPSNSAAPRELNQDHELYVDSNIVQATYEASVVEDTDNQDEILDELFEPPAEILAFEWPAVETHGRSILATNTISELQAVVDRERESVEEDTHVSEAEKSTRLQQLSAADEWLQKSIQFNQRIAQYASQAAEFLETSEIKESLLSEPNDPDEPTTGDEVTSAELNRELQEKRSDYENAKSEFDRYSQAIKTLRERITEIPKQRAAANQRLQEIEEAIIHNEDGDNDAVNSAESNSEIRLLLQYARKRATEAELKMLDVEVEQQESAAKIFPLERDLVSRKLSKLETEIKLWETAATEARKKENLRESKLAREAAVKADPQLREWAERNQVLVEERAQLYEKLSELEDEITDVRKLADEIAEKRQSVQEKIEAAGLTNETGMLLIKMRRNLVSPGKSYVRIQQVQTELKQVNLSVVALSDEREELAQPRKLIENKLGEKTELLDMAIEFVDAKREYLDQLLLDYNNYRGLLADVNIARGKLVDEIQLTADYIDENALWIRSTATLGLDDFAHAASAIHATIEPGHWREFAKSSLLDKKSSPLVTAIGIGGLLILSVVNFRLRSRLKRGFDDQR